MYLLQQFEENFADNTDSYLASVYIHIMLVMQSEPLEHFNKKLHKYRVQQYPIFFSIFTETKLMFHIYSQHCSRYVSLVDAVQFN